MKKFIKLIALNVAVLFVAQFGMGKLLDHFYQKSSIFKTNIIYSKSYNIENKDILILGGSRGLTGLNSKYLSDKTHKTIFNLATDDTQLPVHLMQLKMLLSRGIRPKCIILDLLSEEGFSHSALRFMPLIGDADVDDFFRKFNGNTWIVLQEVFPLYKYIYYNVELLYPSFIVARKHKYQYRSDENGDYQYPDVVGNLKKDSISVMRLQQSATYENFRKLCDQNGIRLVTLIEPFYMEKVETVYPEVINFSTLYNDKPQYFFDYMHLNATGRTAYNVVVADTLLKLGLN